MSEKYPLKQYNLLDEFAEADKQRELKERKELEDKERDARIRQALDELDNEPPDPYGEINPAARNYKPKEKKPRTKSKPKKTKLSPEQEWARQQEAFMRRHYDGRRK